MGTKRKKLEVDAVLVLADGTVIETTVEWWPIDKSPEADAERAEIAARLQASKATKH